MECCNERLQGVEILALLEDGDFGVDGDVERAFGEEAVDGVMRSLQRDVMGVDVDGGALLSSSLLSSNCYLQSDSAYSLSSSSSRLSDVNVIDCRCGCAEIRTEDQLGYLMEASDEELGLSPPLPPPPPPPPPESHFEWWEECGLQMESWNEFSNFELCGVVTEVEGDVVGMEGEGFPCLNSTFLRLNWFRVVYQNVVM